MKLLKQCTECSSQTPGWVWHGVEGRDDNRPEKCKCENGFIKGIPTLKKLVGKDKKVYFSFYREGELWYKTEKNQFEFPIPPEDMKGAIFKAEDKSIFFMRFIRRHLDYLSECVHNEGGPNET